MLVETEFESASAWPSLRLAQAGIGENPAPGPPLALTSFRIALNFVKCVKSNEQQRGHGVTRRGCVGGPLRSPRPSAPNREQCGQLGVQSGV
jgi:hypothetical protein